MNPAPVVATIKPKVAKSIIDHLTVLFAAYDAPFGDGGDTRKAKVAGYVWACEGRSAELVEQVVKDFLTGKVKRSPSLRSKLPTSEEFAAQLDARSRAPDAGMSAVAKAHAPPFGPVWGVKLLAVLLAGPEPNMPKPSQFMAALIAKGGEQGERARLDHQANSGFRAVKVMLDQAAEGRGVHVERHFEPIAETMEPVPVAGTVFAQWRTEFASRGWPWLPDTGKQRVVYFPKGGPSSLPIFGQAIGAVAGGGGRELSPSRRDRRGEVNA